MIQRHGQPADFKARVERKILGRLTFEDYAASRALSYAAAGVNFGLMLVVAQLAAQLQRMPGSLRVCLIASSIAIPVWLAMATCTQLTVSMKVPYVQMREVKWIRVLEQLAMSVAALGTGVALFGMLHFLDPLAAVLFLVGLVAGLVAVLAFSREMGRVCGPEVIRELEMEQLAKERRT